MSGDEDPFAEIAEFYLPTRDTRIKAREAIADLRDFESFKVMPEAGGLGDQASEWVTAMRVCMAAKSHVKAIRETQDIYNQTIDSDDDDRMREAWDEYERVRNEHDDLVSSLRKQWKRGRRR